MATVAMVPPQHQSDTIRRSMTHPVHDPLSNCGKRRVNKAQPFDPEELSKRLTAHLEEQKLRSERRRAGKQPTTAAEEPYAYVPKVAAAAFQRTATPDALRQVHKLSQPAVKQQLEHLSIDDPNVQLSSLQMTQAFDKAVIGRDMLRNRNQFQWKNGMEEAAEVDVERDVYKLPQRTFNSEFAFLKSRHDKGVERPLSTGDVLSDEDETSIGSKTKFKPKAVYDGRNDWAQRDDGVDNGRLAKEISNLFLRKKDSLGIIKGRKEKHGKQDQDDAAIFIGDSRSPPDGSKGGRSSFLARFKRYPS